MLGVFPTPPLGTTTAPEPLEDPPPEPPFPPCSLPGTPPPSATAPKPPPAEVIVVNPEPEIDELLPAEPVFG